MNKDAPAFPGVPEGYDPETGLVRAYGGMSIRAYYVGQVLPALVAAELANGNCIGWQTSELIAANAVRVADAAIAELDK